MYHKNITKVIWKVQKFTGKTPKQANKQNSWNAFPRNPDLPCKKSDDWNATWRGPM